MGASRQQFSIWQGARREVKQRLPWRERHNYAVDRQGWVSCSVNDGSWAELYWYAANGNHNEIGGRCLRLGYDDTVSPIRHYHWGVYGTDAKDFAAQEFWAPEMWTTKRYSSALIGGGPCPNLAVADVDDLWAMLTVGAPPVRVLPDRVGPARRRPASRSSWWDCRTALRRWADQADERRHGRAGRRVLEVHLLDYHEAQRSKNRACADNSTLGGLRFGSRCGHHCAIGLDVFVLDPPPDAHRIINAPPR